MITKKIIIIFIFLGSIAIGIGYWQNRAKKQAILSTQTATVVKKNLDEELILSGAIDAKEKAALRFLTSGKLIYVGVKKGEYVKKGQLIARLDEREVKKKLEKELNDYLKTRWDLDQTRENNKDKAITNALQRVLDQSQFDLNNSVLDVEIQNLAVEFSRLISPIEGVVTEVGSPFAGVNITPSQAEFEIVNPKTLYFSATADQSDVTKIYQGMNGRLLLDPFSENEITGSVEQISFTPEKDETGAVYEVSFTFPVNENDYLTPKYRIGMTGDLVLIINQKVNVLTVPNQFVKDENSKKYVNVEVNGKKIKQFISTGLETETETEIKSGLNQGEKVYDQAN